jgi:hypothetical protein
MGPLGRSRAPPPCQDQVTFWRPVGCLRLVKLLVDGVAEGGVSDGCTGESAERRLMIFTKAV